MSDDSKLRQLLARFELLIIIASVIGLVLFFAAVIHPLVNSLDTSQREVLLTWFSGLLGGLVIGGYATYGWLYADPLRRQLDMEVRWEIWKRTESVTERFPGIGEVNWHEVIAQPFSSRLPLLGLKRLGICIGVFAICLYWGFMIVN